MVLGPRLERPFSELMTRLAEAGIPFRFSMAVEGGGMAGSGPSLSLAAASVLAVTSEDSRHVRDALTGSARRARRRAGGGVASGSGC